MATYAEVVAPWRYKQQWESQGWQGYSSGKAKRRSNRPWSVCSCGKWNYTGQFKHCPWCGVKVAEFPPLDGGLAPAPGGVAVEGQLPAEQLALFKQLVDSQKDSPLGPLLAKLLQQQPGPAGKSANPTKALTAAKAAKERAEAELSKSQKHLGKLEEQVKEAKDKVEAALEKVREAELSIQQALQSCCQELGKKGPVIEEIPEEEEDDPFGHDIEVDQEGDVEIVQAKKATQAAGEAFALARKAQQDARKVLASAQETSAKRRKKLDDQGKLDLAKAAAEAAGQLPPG